MTTLDRTKVTYAENLQGYFIPEELITDTQPNSVSKAPCIIYARQNVQEGFDLKHRVLNGKENPMVSRDMTIDSLKNDSSIRDDVISLIKAAKDTTSSRATFEKAKRILEALNAN